MKRITIISLVTLMLAACNSTSPNKQQQLDKLRSERSKLNAQISQLEKELGTSKGGVQKIIPVAVNVLQPSVFKNYIEVQGKVDAQKNVTVTAEAAAVVKAIDVQTGQQVSAGQTLAQLDDNVVRQQIAQLQTQLAFTKNIYDRQENLWKQNIGTKVQLLTAQNNYENVQKQIQVLESQLSMYSIKAPFSGVVDNVIARLGQAVSPGVPTFTIVNLTDLKVTGQIGENYVGKVHTGDKVDIIFPDLQDTLRTTVTYVSKVIDPVSRAFTVDIRLPHSAVYHPNMLAVIRVVSYQDNNAITVPISVLQHDATGNFVYISENNKVKKVPVTVNQTYGGYAEITSGLKAGEQLIVAGYDNVNSGDTVQVQ